MRKFRQVPHAATAACLAAALGACGQTETQTTDLRSTRDVSADQARSSSERGGMQVDTPLVTVSLLANGKDGTVTVLPGTIVDLVWSSEGAAFCLAPLGAITLNGHVQTAPIHEPATFTFTCTGAEGRATDSVDVLVGEPAPPSPPSGGVPLRLEVTRENSLGYCSADDGDPATADPTLVLDIAYPKDGAGPFPAIIFVHGGGWVTGSRQAFSDAVYDAAARGYVAASIEYRLTGALFPGQVEDVKCAVRYLKAQAATYRANPDKIGLMGASSGAHLAMLAAFSATGTMEGNGGHALQTSVVQAVVGWSGPANLTTLYPTLSVPERNTMSMMLGGTPSQVPAAYTSASPVTHVSAGDPPTWITHGAIDQRVPLTQSEALRDVLTAQQITSTLEILPGQGHDFQGNGLIQATESAFAFFAKHLK